MTVYYHSNRQFLRPGTIVDPGNYGRLVNQARECGPHWNRELVLEEVRRKRFPNKPSRLSSCFVTDNIETAEFYHRNHCPEGYLYTVVLEDSSQLLHVGDFNCIQPLPGRNETMEQIAERYWACDLRTKISEHLDMVCNETVTTSALRVVSPIYLRENFGY